MKSEGLLPYSQDLATFPLPEPRDYSPHPQRLFLKLFRAHLRRYILFPLDEAS
jgi:hypothetical protein